MILSRMFFDCAKIPNAHLLDRAKSHLFHASLACHRLHCRLLIWLSGKKHLGNQDQILPPITSQQHTGRNVRGLSTRRSVCSGNQVLIPSLNASCDNTKSKFTCTTALQARLMIYAFHPSPLPINPGQKHADLLVAMIYAGCKRMSFRH